MAAIVLDAHRNLFRDNAAFDQFVALFQEDPNHPGFTPVWAKQKHLTILLSPTNAKELVQDRMLRRMLEQPSLLDEMKNRLESDDIVE